MSKNNNKSFGFIRRFHIIPKILCVVFAFIFWIYVMEVDSPDHEETFTNVPVTVVGATTLDNDKNLSVFSGYDAVVDVTVKGQKSVISRYTADDIIVNVDVSDIKNSGLFNLDLHFDLPAGMSYVKSSAKTADIYIDKKITKSFPVTAHVFNYKILSDKYVIGNTTCGVETVTVSGPETRINEIDKAVVEMDLGGIDLVQSFTKDGEIILKDQYDALIDTRYIRFSKSTNVNVQLQVKEYIPLRYDTVYGLFTSKNSTITIEPSAVMIQGDPAIVDRIQYISISDIDEKTVKGDYAYQEYINIPDNVTLVPGEPTFATVAIDLSSNFITKEVVVDSDNFTVINTGGKDVKILDETLKITVVGERGAVNRVTEENILVTVDYTGYADNNGVSNIKIPCTITFDIDSQSGVVYEYGTYELWVQPQ